MMKNLRNKLLNERGDLMQSVLTFPLAVIMLFMLINFATFFQLRSEVLNIARDGARLVALYGGEDRGAVRNIDGRGVEQIVLDSIWDGDECKLSYCSQQPEVICAPHIAYQAGELASCEIIYYYTAVAPMWGLENLTAQKIHVSATYITETGIG